MRVNADDEIVDAMDALDQAEIDADKITGAFCFVAGLGIGFMAGLLAAGVMLVFAGIK